MEQPPESNNLDRLSDLPDSIFHQILDFLHIKQVARVSTLSRRCRKVCLSSPFLTIDLEVRDHIELYRLNTFLHRFMSLRNGACMHQFKVDMYRANWNDYDEELQIGNWVLEATRDLEVDMAPDSLLNLPASSFGGLESLTLRHLSVSIALFGEWISSFKSLKMLYLDGVTGICELNISSSSLEKLILEDLIGFYGINANFNIKVSAETLRYCEIFESLSYSDISILPCPISADEHGDLANGIIGKVLQTIYRVSSICIHDLCIKVEEKIHYSAEYWESHNLEFVRSLKEVEMEIKGKDSEMELIKYFLKNAKALKKMTILYPSALRRQSMISRKIQQFQMASSSIVLYFLQK
nr:F-box/FBD/LRR-repeat protein At5g22660-like [Ziziphus jujuba var. spinosa]